MYDDIPNLEGKVAIVTGGNIGIGKITCRVLLEKGAKVYMAARTKEKAIGAIEELQKSTGKQDIHWLPLDLASFASIRDSAATFNNLEKELHILINNAGIMATPLAYTKEGYEMQWGTNVVGHFYFFQLLLPTLLSTASNSPKGSVRVINVSSMAHSMAPRDGVDYEDINLASYWFPEWRRYGQSKLGNILLTKEITKRYGTQNVVSVAVHPGVIDTQLSTKVVDRGWFINSLMYLMKPKRISLDEGAYTQVFAATHPRVMEENMNGKYLIPMGQIGQPSAIAENPEAAEKLWNYLEKEIESKN